MAIHAYLRVSTTDQTTENQLIEIERAGFKPEYVYADEGVSGGVLASQRPEFQRFLGFARAGETLVVSKLDRLGRNAMDVLGTVKLLEERGIKLIVLALGSLDLTSSAGKLMLTMLAAVAEMERDLLIERTKAGLVRAKAEGKKVGRPSKLSDKQKAEVRKALEAGETIYGLAKRYDCPRGTIRQVRKSMEG